MAGGGFASKPVQNVSSNQQMPQGGGKGSGMISPILQSRPMFGGSSSYIDAVKESLAKSYGDSPDSQEVQPSTETSSDILKKYTEGTGTDYSSSGTSQEEILKKIEEQQEALKDLTVTETTTRMVPQYEKTTPSPMQGAFTSPPPTYETVSELPKGATLVQGQYGRQFYQVPMEFTQMGQQNTNPTYRQVGSKKVTTSNERPAVAGDSVYDAAQKTIDSLQKTYDLRNKYSNSTGTQGFIADPLANPGQTGYNNINEIMKRYIG